MYSAVAGKTFCECWVKLVHSFVQVFNMPVDFLLVVSVIERGIFKSLTTFVDLCIASAVLSSFCFLYFETQ